MRRTVCALAVLVLAAACGGDDEDSSPGADASTSVDPTATAAADEPTTTGGGTAEDAGVAAVDVCALLGEEALIGAAPARGAWEVTGSDAGTCTWSDGEGATVTVTVASGMNEVLDALRASSDGERAVEELDVFAGGAIGVYDRDGLMVEAHAPAGADEVVAVIQDGADLDEATMLSLLEQLALAWENRPLGEEADTEDGPGPTGDGEDPFGVRFEVSSEGGGLDLEFEVTAEDVRERPGTAQVLCVGIDATRDEGIFEGTYTVMGTDVDTSRTEGLVNASVTAVDTIDGPGSYPATFEAGDTDGRTVTVDGEVSIDESLVSGSFLGTDEAGNEVSVSFECLL